jgi:hypothetical protein
MLTRMMNLSTSDFSYRGGSFSQEISTLQLRHPLSPVIALKSDKTGTVVRYRLHHEDTDRDGDVLAWYYMPEPVDVKAHPEARRTDIVIFND